MRRDESVIPTLQGHPSSSLGSSVPIGWKAFAGLPGENLQVPTRPWRQNSHIDRRPIKALRKQLPSELLFLVSHFPILFLTPYASGITSRPLRRNSISTNCKGQNPVGQEPGAERKSWRMYLREGPRQRGRVRGTAGSVSRVGKDVSSPPDTDGATAHPGCGALRVGPGFSGSLSHTEWLH